MADVEKYESHQVVIRKPESRIYTVLSDFKNFSPALEGKVDDWKVEGDSCSFKVKGMKIALRIAERVDNKHVKIVADEGGIPIDFTFWVQLHEVDAHDTRVRMVLHAELNMMMRMMIGGKIQAGLDQAVEGLATALNNFR